MAKWKSGQRPGNLTLVICALKGSAAGKRRVEGLEFRCERLENSGRNTHRRGGREKACVKPAINGDNLLSVGDAVASKLPPVCIWIAENNTLHGTGVMKPNDPRSAIVGAWRDDCASSRRETRR